MPATSSDDDRELADIAVRHGFSVDAAREMVAALQRGWRSMAQFNHPEFGGYGQWMRGGMTMVGDMFNASLRNRVDALAQDLSAYLASGSGRAAPSMAPTPSTRTPAPAVAAAAAAAVAPDAAAPAAATPAGAAAPTPTAARPTAETPAAPPTSPWARPLAATPARASSSASPPPTFRTHAAASTSPWARPSDAPPPSSTPTAAAPMPSQSQSQRQGDARSGSFASAAAWGDGFAAAAAWSGNWWPDELHTPNSTGSQNEMRYAYFADLRRLAIDDGRTITVYDTLDHRIGGFSQQQSGTRSMTMSSQHGPIELASLPVVSRTPSRR